MQAGMHYLVVKLNMQVIHAFFRMNVTFASFSLKQ